MFSSRFFDAFDAATDAAAEEEVSRTFWGDYNHPLHVSVALPRHTFHVGEEVPLRVRIHNTSRKPLKEVRVSLDTQPGAETVTLQEELSQDTMERTLQYPLAPPAPAATRTRRRRHHNHRHRAAASNSPRQAHRAEDERRERERREERTQREREEKRLGPEHRLLDILSQQQQSREREERQLSSVFSDIESMLASHDTLVDAMWAHAAEAHETIVRRMLEMSQGEEEEEEEREATSNHTRSPAHENWMEEGAEGEKEEEQVQEREPSSPFTEYLRVEYVVPPNRPFYMRVPVSVSRRV